MIKNLRIIRVENGEEGTFGVMTYNGFAFCVTLERQWKNNAKGISCIPEGQYFCRRHRSVNYPDTFEVCDVPGRSGILFHAGNHQHDSMGCILLGASFVKLNTTDRVIANSGETFRLFQAWMKPDTECKLTIVSCY